MINTIWISTAPRTGSMWLFNVVRELYRANGKHVEPEDIPQSNEEMFKQATSLAFASHDPLKVWVLKVHAILKSGLPQSKIITSHRDVRDVVVSFKEFMNTSFENSIDCARTVVNFIEIYKNYDSRYLKMVAYEDIELRPQELLRELADFLQIPITEANVKEIALKFSRQKVRGLIANSDRKIAQKIEQRQPIDQRDIVYLSKSNYRAYDRKTGFQTGHISQRETGDWRKHLSESEQQQLHAEFGSWLKRFGYIKK